MKYEIYEPMKLWLSHALVRINKLPEDSGQDKAKNELARRIVKGLEMDNLCEPMVWRDKSGVVHLFWERAARDVEFFIHAPGRFKAVQNDPKWDAALVTVCCRDWQQTARQIMKWLYPAANGIQLEEMIPEQKGA